MQNKYIKDASIFLKRASELASSELSDVVVIEGVLFLALGMERVLKSILFEVNPIYVLQNQEFKNTAPILYKDKLISSCEKAEIADTPNGDVLTFRRSLLRAKVFSQATHKHSSLLFALCSYRDIIAHCNLSNLNMPQLRLLLIRDAYVLLTDYSDELGIDPEEFFGSHQRKLTTLSADNQDSLQKRLETKLGFHKGVYERHRGDENFDERMRKRTEYVVHRFENDYRHVEMISCPACSREAVVKIEVDYDVCDGHGMPCGVFVTGMECMYCQLRIDEYDEIDALGLNDLLTNQDDCP